MVGYVLEALLHHLTFVALNEEMVFLHQRMNNEMMEILITKTDDQVREMLSLPMNAMVDLLPRKIHDKKFVVMVLF